MATRGRPQKGATPVQHRPGDEVYTVYQVTGRKRRAAIVAVDDVSNETTVRYFADGAEEKLTADKLMPVEEGFSRSPKRGTPRRRRSRSRSRSRSPARPATPRKKRLPTPRRSATKILKAVRKANAAVEQDVSFSDASSEPETPMTRSVTRALSAEAVPAEFRGQPVVPESRQSYPDPKTETGVTPMPTTDSRLQALAPKTMHYEFMGPIGVLLMIIGLPTVVYALYFACGPTSCSIRDVTDVKLPNWRAWFSLKASVLFLAWFAFHCFLYTFPVGKVAQGTKLRDGRQLNYRLNAFFSLVISMCVVGLLHLAGLRLSVVYDRYLELITAATVFSLLLSVFVYWLSRRKDAMLAAGGNTGNVLYDFFIGRELNPRLGASFDIKEFCELRPGLVGWIVICLGFAMKQWELHGQVTPPMILICLFQFVYVADGLWFEEAILTTMDITTDGFGFMLAFGDLVWVPFTYTVQARYLVDHPVELSYPQIALVLAVEVLGFILFRGANSQKDNFRRDPNSPSSRKLKTMPTARGTQLIISGYWGFVRHPNYLGDLMMALAWCMCTGYMNIITYFYVIYFTILLIHRASRDDAMCRAKYGRDWDAYCAKVRYRIFPYIY